MDKKLEVTPEAVKDTVKKKEVEKEVKPIEKLSLYAKLMHMRVDLQKCGIKKTGENKHSGFMYYELADFLPQCNQIACDYNSIFLYQLEKEQATLTLINCDNTEEKLSFYLPITDVAIPGAAKIQNVGGLVTYTRRYLYMIVFEVSEGDPLDRNQNDDDKVEPPKPKNIHAEPTQQQLDEVEDIKNKKIEALKVVMLRKKLGDLFIPEEAMCERFKVAAIEDITEGIFPRVLSAIKATEDKANEK